LCHNKLITIHPKLLFALIFAGVCIITNAQHNYKTIVQEKASKELLNGVYVTIKNNGNKGAITDASGGVFYKNNDRIESVTAKVEILGQEK